MNLNHFIVEWRDGGQEPECEPDPRYPNGIDINACRANEVHCKVELPYPAKRIGVYMIECTRCGFRAACTTAGRVDDPKSITLPCRAT